jgi:CMP-N,N'-diacetyllegionaminic acid synthase
MIALIPARGGSKGLPGKNIKDLCGKPLIAYTIEAAAKAKYIDDIILSTDDETIAEVGRHYGAKVPYLRPKELATDNALGIDNYIYTVERLNKEFNYTIDEFAVLLPTCPLRTHEDIDNAIELFFINKADSVISFCRASHPPAWAKKINGDGILEDYFKTPTDNKNRQAIENAYMPNGAIYVLKHKLVKERYSLYSERTYAYIMPPERSFDIDSAFDFELTELYIKKLNGFN